MKNVLITGDSGMVGRCVVAQLRRMKGFKPIGLGRRHDKNLGYETIDFDLTGPGIPTLSNIDYVIH
ncbi:MAG: hypothetical protein AABX51_03380, partial [Nanoarchaeota archaeon]